MLKWSFHQYSGYKKPFVWHITGITAEGRLMHAYPVDTGCPRYQNLTSVRLPQDPSRISAVLPQRGGMHPSFRTNSLARGIHML